MIPSIMQDHFETLSETREEIQRRIGRAGIELVEPDFFSDSFKSFSSGVKYGQTLLESAELKTYKGRPTRKFAHAVIVRFEPGYTGTRTYELTFYVL